MKKQKNRKRNGSKRVGQRRHRRSSAGRRRRPNHTGTTFSSAPDHEARHSANDYDVIVTDTRDDGFDVLAELALRQWQSENRDVSISVDPAHHICMEYLEPVVLPNQVLRVGSVVVLSRTGNCIGEVDILMRPVATA